MKAILNNVLLLSIDALFRIFKVLNPFLDKEVTKHSYVFHIWLEKIERHGGNPILGLNSVRVYPKKRI